MRPPKPVNPHAPQRRGIVAVYAMVLMVALVGFCSLAVDYGRVQVVKTQLQRTADAACRAAAQDFPNGIASCTNAAVTLAAQNLADGTPVTLDPNNDVEFGTWDPAAKTFTPLAGTARSNANAIRVTARRESSRGTAVPLQFAKLIGRPSQDVRATAIAKFTMTAGKGPAFNGLLALVAGDGFVGSYNSAVNLAPTQLSARPNGSVGSNLFMVVADMTVRGDVMLGPGAWYLHGVMLISGAVKSLPAAIATPALASTTPAANPAGTSQSLSVSGTTTLPAGNYYFTSLTLANNAVLQFAGPATVRLNGSATLGSAAKIQAYGSVPSNLKVYQTGVNAIVAGPNADITAVLEGPASALVAGPSLMLRGSATFAAMTLADGAELFYDEALGTAGSSFTISLSK